MTHSLLDGAKLFGLFAIVAERAGHEALKKSAELVRDEAKSAIGTYRYGWPPLGEDAVARHGDTPLLETGELRDSIEAVVVGHAAYIGTNDPKAPFHEHGTVHIPPRSFMRSAAMAKAHEVREICGRDLAKKMFGGKD